MRLSRGSLFKPTNHSAHANTPLAPTQNIALCKATPSPPRRPLAAPRPARLNWPSRLNSRALGPAPGSRPRPLLRTRLRSRTRGPAPAARPGSAAAGRPRHHRPAPARLGPGPAPARLGSALRAAPGSSEQGPGPQKCGERRRGAARFQVGLGEGAGGPAGGGRRERGGWGGKGQFAFKQLAAVRQWR